VGAESRVGAKANIGAKFIAGATTGVTVTRLDVTNSTQFAAIATKKSFDIDHPTKDGWRLRHISVESPQAEVYVRGKIGGTIIELPDYWRGLVDEESITVTLTPLNGWQELYVKEIRDNKIHIRNNTCGAIYCSYVVYAERKDVIKNIVEYEGQSINDYPINDKEHIIHTINNPIE
jgi:hypothetical protein